MQVKKTTWNLHVRKHNPAPDVRKHYVAIGGTAGFLGQKQAHYGIGVKVPSFGRSCMPVTMSAMLASAISERYTVLGMRATIGPRVKLHNWLDYGGAWHRPHDTGLGRATLYGPEAWKLAKAI